LLLLLLLLLPSTRYCHAISSDGCDACALKWVCRNAGVGFRLRLKIGIGP
jgi:hypothetical protein